MKTARKVLVVLQGLDRLKSLILSSCTFLTNWSKLKTAQQFYWYFDFQNTPTVFKTVSGQIIQGFDNRILTGKYLDPAQIVLEANYQPYDTVALLYHNKLYPKDLYSVHNQILVNAASVIQLPISDEANEEGIVTNLSHELSHEGYSALRWRGVQLVDDVHQHSGPYDPRPQANYSDILTKWAPYYPYLSMTPTKCPLTLWNQITEIYKTAFARNI